MIRIFHPNHGYLLVTDDNEKKRLLETGGYVSESFQSAKMKIDIVEDVMDSKTEIVEPKRGRPKKCQ